HNRLRRRGQTPATRESDPRLFALLQPRLERLPQRLARDGQVVARAARLELHDADDVVAALAVAACVRDRLGDRPQLRAAQEAHGDLLPPPRAEDNLTWSSSPVVSRWSSASRSS